MGSFGTLIPRNASTSPLDVEVGVKFQVRGNAVVTGIRFYKATANVGLHVGNLWDASGNLVASTSFDNETAVGWQQADFAAPVALQPGVTYVASYRAPNGAFSFALDGDADSLTTGRDDPSGPARILANGEDGGNGVFRYGGGFPSASFRAANYFVDPVVDDMTAPTISAALTVEAEQGAARLRWDAASDGADGVYRHLVYRDGELVADLTGATTTFLDTSVVEGSTYEYVVRGEDHCGNLSEPSNAATYTAASFGSEGATIYGDDAPASTFSSEQRPVYLGHRFSASVTGTITAVRFWRDVPNPGPKPFEVSLWRASDGRQLAAGVWTAGSTPGWQEVTLDTPVAIDADTEYMAVYRTDGEFSLCQSLTALPASPLRSVSFAYTYEGTNWTGYPTTASALNYCVDVRMQVGPPAGPAAGQTLFGSEAPASFFSATGPAVEVGVKVVARSSGVIRGIRTYRSGGSEPLTVSLWSSSGTLLGRASDVTGSTPGWQTIEFSEPIAVDACTQYVASVHAPGGDFVYTPIGLLNDVVSGDLTAPGSAVAGGNGLFVYSASPAFPEFTYFDSNYWIDVDFVAQPAEALTVYGGQEPPPHVLNVGQPDINVGVKIIPTADGFIRAVRFFRDCGGSADYTASLWTATGTRLAEATVPTHEPVNGWQTATFDEPVAVTAQTTYIAAYHAPGGCFPSSFGSFTQDVVVPGLTIPSSPSSGGNGVFSYSTTPEFPNSVSPLTNYWVDVELEVTP
ncbi:MAG: DUF4082 domain-containing protein [Myxococcota bacterium]